MTAADPVFTAAAKDITFTDAGAGSLVLADIADLTLSSAGAGNIDVQVAIAGTADGDSSGDDATDVTINAGDGTVSIEGIGTDINDVSLTSTASITLKGDITTAGDSDDGSGASGAVTFTGPVLLAPITGNDIEINTKSASNNGAVNFSGSTSTVNTSVDNAAKTLTILSGSGKVTFDGVIYNVAIIQI